MHVAFDLPPLPPVVMRWLIGERIMTCEGTLFVFRRNKLKHGATKARIYDVKNIHRQGAMGNNDAIKNGEENGMFRRM